MKPIRLTLWIPCALAALSLHALGFAAWLALRRDAAIESSAVATFVLRATSVAEQEPEMHLPPPEAEREREADSIRTRLLEALGRRSDGQEWEGEFDTSDGYTGTQLTLTRDGFVETGWCCTGQSSRWGSVAADSDSVTLRPIEVPAASERLFVMPRHGRTYLVSTADMRDFLEQALSEFLEFPTRGSRFLSKPGASRADQDEAPEGYRQLWARLPHVAVIRVIEATGPAPRLVELQLPEESELPAPQLTLYWDLDPTGCVRAIERERIGTRMIALLDDRGGISARSVAPGSTFTSLARLR